MAAAKMHVDEVETDVPLVRRLIVAQFPQWADLPIEPVDSAGTDNAMYRLGDDMAVRLPRFAGAVANVELEQRWLPRLAPLLPVAVPVPLGKGRPAEGYPWIWSVYRWLAGENPTADRIAEPGPLARDLAAFITALRRIDPTDGPPAGRGVPLPTRDAPTRAAIEELHGMIDTTAATAAWEQALRIPEWSGRAAWVHGDLSPGNVLVSHGRLSAVIDFAGVGVGDPTVDLIVAWNLLPALIQLPYYRETNPVLAANSRHVIREVLADHERTQ